MASAMNGISLHGGFVAAGATFMVFTDYARPAMRLAALMGLPAVYVMTHDSIGLGEDGPTHQPVEHLAALRAIPNMRVFRPCDAMETAECWQLALQRTDGPTVLALTRQNLPPMRKEPARRNLCAAGAYEIAPSIAGQARVAIFATGSEVSIAVDAKKLLDGQGVLARVVSVPCAELFMAQAPEARAVLIGSDPVRVAVEAGVRQGWDAIIGADGAFVGMTGFGASAPYKDLYKHFGITPEKVAEAALKKLGKN
jgi:transketolase